MKSILTLTGMLPAFAYAVFAAPDAASGAAAGGKPTTKPTAKPANTKPTEASAKPTEAKPVEPAAEPAAEPKRGVGTVAMEAILNSATNEETLAAVRKEFPDANTTKASINWYRNKLRKDGTICTGGTYIGKPVPNAREMTKDAKTAEAPKAKNTKPAAATATGAEAGAGAGAETEQASAGDDPTA